MTMVMIQVLGDATLFRHITAFQCGLNMPLLAFWRAHRGENAPLRFGYATDRALVELLVKHGSLQLLRMAERARLCVPPQLLSSTLFGHGPAYTPTCNLQLDRVAYLALEQNRPEMVEWALTSMRSKVYAPVDAWGEAIARAGQDGDLRMLENLRKYTPLPTQYQIDHIWRLASEYMKHASVVRLMVDAFPAMPVTLAMVTVAAAHCDLPLLEQLHARGVTALHYHGFGATPVENVGTVASRGVVRFDAVLAARDRDVLEFLLEHFHQHLDRNDAAKLAATTDPDLHQLALRFAGSLQRACVEQITGLRASHETVRQWISTGILSPQWPISIDAIASNGMLDVLRLLHEHGIATATTDAMDFAAERAHWEVVEFLHSNRSEGCTTRAMDAAIQQDNLHYVLFLRGNRTEGCSPQAAEKAVTNIQSTAMLRFLHEHIDIPFTPAVMDLAASRGNLAAVRFLHENRAEGCTTAAMDNAASDGHLRVVQYLHTHRSEGCTFAALRGAMQSRRVDIVRFLLHNYRHLFDHADFNQALVTATVEGWLAWPRRRDGIELLFDHFPQLFAPELLRVCLAKGVYHTLRTQYPHDILSRELTESMIVDSALYEASLTMELGAIHYIVDVLGRRDLAHRALEGAAMSRECGIHWLRAVYAITGPQSCRLSAVQAAIRLAAVKNCTLDRVKFLIRHCCEPNALQAAIEMFPSFADAAVVTELRNWDPAADVDADDELQPLHPFLLDPRVSSWAITDLLKCVYQHVSPRRQTWAAEAVSKHDVAMLEVIRDTIPLVDHTHANHGETLDAQSVAQHLRYDGATTRAIFAESLEALQWLFTNVYGPTDPTLLGVAVYRDKREIAEWLVAHHPEACVRVQWESMSDEYDPFHVSEDVAHWLEHTPAVRNALNFGSVVRYLAERDDVESLRRLHALDSDRVVVSTELLALAKQTPGAKVAFSARSWPVMHT